MEFWLPRLRCAGQPASQGPGLHHFFRGIHVSILRRDKGCPWRSDGQGIRDSPRKQRPQEGALPDRELPRLPSLQPDKIVGRIHYEAFDFLYISPSHFEESQNGNQSVIEDDANLMPKTYVICQFVSVDTPSSPVQLNPNDIYWSEKTKTVPVTVVKGKCAVWTKKDFVCMDFPYMNEYTFFCEYVVADPDHRPKLQLGRAVRVKKAYPLTQTGILHCFWHRILVIFDDTLVAILGLLKMGRTNVGKVESFIVNLLICEVNRGFTVPECVLFFLGFSYFAGMAMTVPRPSLVDGGQPLSCLRIETCIPRNKWWSPGPREAVALILAPLGAANARSALTSTTFGFLPWALRYGEQMKKAVFLPWKSPDSLTGYGLYSAAKLEMAEVDCGGVRRWTLDMGSAGDATRRDGGGARLPVVASSLLVSFFKATPLADGEAAGDTAKGEDGGR
nr:DNA (cytosine-5)-methyltransferase 1B-like [Ipomoea batatas]